MALYPVTTKLNIIQLSNHCQVFRDRGAMNTIAPPYSARVSAALSAACRERQDLGRMCMPLWAGGKKGCSGLIILSGSPLYTKMCKYIN